MRWGTAPILILLGVTLLASGAGAHALLRSSDPGSDAVLQQPPQAVTLTFTEEPEPALSVVRVLDSSGRAVASGPAQAVPGRPLELRVSLRSLSEGVYTVSWRTVSRVDGHVTGGAFAFGVGVTPARSLAPQATVPPPSPWAVATRWGLYAGLSALLGAGWVWAIAMREVPPGGVAYLWLSWAVAAGGLAGLGVTQAADAGVGMGLFLQTSLGRELWWRALPLAAGGITIAAAPVLDNRWRLPLLWGLTTASAAAMLGHVLAGHAGATPGPWRWATVLDQVAHFVGVGTWMGGLAALLAAARGAADDNWAFAVRRFSAVAGGAIGVVALTGVVRAVQEVGAWSALLSTDFGRLVMLKTVLLLVLAVLGAVNRSRHVPRSRYVPHASTSLRGLRRVGGAELCVAGVVLGVTGVLTSLAPPVYTQGTSAAPSAVGVSGSDFATSVRVRLEIVPGFSGLNRFVARIVDYDTGRPITADRVTLRFLKPDRPGLGASTLSLVRTGDSTYEGEGANLSLEGPWTVTAVIERGPNSTDVPLTVTPRSRPQTVRTITAPGQPTLYSVDLPGGRVLDVYLDPQRPGLNEVHATFIDAPGGELPIPRPAAMTVSRPGEKPRSIPVRRFGPGHFIGDAQLSAGDWDVTIRATTREGTEILTSLTVHL